MNTYYLFVLLVGIIYYSNAAVVKVVPNNVQELPKVENPPQFNILRNKREYDYDHTDGHETFNPVEHEQYSDRHYDYENHHGHGVQYADHHDEYENNFGHEYGGHYSEYDYDRHGPHHGHEDGSEFGYHGEEFEDQKMLKSQDDLNFNQRGREHGFVIKSHAKRNQNGLYTNTNSE